MRRGRRGEHLGEWRERPDAVLDPGAGRARCRRDGGAAGQDESGEGAEEEDQAAGASPGSVPPGADDAGDHDGRVACLGRAMKAARARRWSGCVARLRPASPPADDRSPRRRRRHARRRRGPEAGPASDGGPLARSWRRPGRGIRDGCPGHRWRCSSVNVDSRVAGRRAAGRSLGRSRPGSRGGGEQGCAGRLAGCSRSCGWRPRGRTVQP